MFCVSIYLYLSVSVWCLEKVGDWRVRCAIPCQFLNLVHEALVNV